MSKDDVSPCSLDEYEGQFSLMFADFDDAFWSLTESHGGQGGGYSLDAMIQAAIEMESLDLPDLEYASEGGAFYMRGTKPSLLKVAAIIKRFLNDRVYAEGAINHAERQGYFE